MVSREQESLTDPDPHSLLFGHDDESDHEAGPPAISRRVTRALRRRVRRSRRTFSILASVSLVVVLAVGYAGYRAYQSRYHPKDYAGSGTGTAVVIVHTGDGASAIGSTLVSAGVVASTRAFVNAAHANSDAQNISPGTYQLHKHMSAKTAVALLLDPSARLSHLVSVFPGATVLDIAGPLAKALNVPVAKVTAALADTSSLGLPSGYTATTATPKSVEGFLFPATYSFD
ncbi:MAG: hypothetical protein QOG80_3154, partial [Pseudonocardiales bacterium]|nr:hypothetical protein [Pseudonocardiales bacterium]